MNEQALNVGETAIVINAQNYHRYIGTECEILERIEYGVIRNGQREVVVKYEARLIDGCRGYFEPEQLRKIRPPIEHSGERVVFDMIDRLTAEVAK